MGLREKMLSSSVQCLSDTELIAVLLGSGCRNRSILEVAQALSLRDFQSCSPKDLLGEPGLGPAKVCTLFAALELGRRWVYAGPVLDKPKDVFAFVIEMAQYKKEVLRVLGLNAKNRLVVDEVVAVGTLVGCSSHPREIFKPLIVGEAFRFVLVHNHPSGDSTPSQEDFDMTAQVRVAADCIGIPMVDHLIVARQGYYSFKQNNFIGTLAS